MQPYKSVEGYNPSFDFESTTPKVRTVKELGIKLRDRVDAQFDQVYIGSMPVSTYNSILQQESRGEANVAMARWCADLVSNHNITSSDPLGVSPSATWRIEGDQVNCYNRRPKYIDPIIKF